MSGTWKYDEPEVENVTREAPMPKSDESVRKQKQRRIYLKFALSERRVTSPGVTLIMSPG